MLGGRTGPQTTRCLCIRAIVTARTATIGFETWDVGEPATAALDAPSGKYHPQAHEQDGEGEHEESNEDGHERSPSL